MLGGTEDDRRTGRSKQVWFPGVHSDVGGGYPESESGLADLALDWMLSEAGAIDQPAIVDVFKAQAVTVL